MRLRRKTASTWVCCSSRLVFSRQSLSVSIPLWLTTAFQGAGDLLVLWATTGTDVSLTVDGWSGSIWSVQPWTGMMNTASSVNSCHQSRGAPMAADSHTPAPGPRCGQQETGPASECGSIRRASVTHGNVKKKRKKKVCIAKKMKCIDTEAGRLADLFQQRVVSERGVLRTGTQRLDKSWLYIVFPCSPKWNVLHPCLLGCIDMERH